MLQYLDPSSEETQALVLTPTRELCIQVTQALRAYAEHLAGRGDRGIRRPGGEDAAVAAARRRPRRRRHGRADAGPDLARLAQPGLGALCGPRRGRRDARPRLHRRRRADPANLPLGPPDLAVLGHHPAADRAARRPLHVRPDHDQGDAAADHRRRDRAGLCRGPGAGQGRPPGRGAAGRGPRAGDHLLPHEDRHRAARRDAPRPAACRSRPCTAT